MPATLLAGNEKALYREMKTFIFFQTQAALFPGDERAASFTDIQYEIPSKLYYHYLERGWPDYIVRIFQDDLAPTTEAIPLRKLAEF